MEAPGIFNKLFGKGKRWIAIFILSGVAVGAIICSVFQTDDAAILNLESMTRRQIWGDAAVIEKGIRSGWADVFTEEGERFLASFAIPGVPAGQRATTEPQIIEALGRRILPQVGDSMEARQIKSMVEGMKYEARRYIKAGGTVKSYGHRLVERQEQELAVYAKVKAELDAMAESGMNQDELEDLWERRNNELRNLGVKLVPMPEVKK